MQRLFERLTHARERRERLAQTRQQSVFDQRESDEIASIKSHLTRLLNTRRGSAHVDKSYGMPALSVTPTHNTLGDRDAIAGLLRNVIEQYDTRLVNVSVHVAPQRGDDVSIDCEIRASIRPDLLQPGMDNRIELHAQLKTDGTIVFN